MKNPPKYVSASQINTFLFCPISYRLSYIDLEEKELPNIYMVFGSAIHEALALNFKQKIKSKKDLEAEEVITKFEEVFNKELKNCIIPQYANPNAMRLEGENMLISYMIDVASKIDPLEVEYKFEIALSKYPITILGYIDLITKDGIIKDHKVVGKTTEKNWTQNVVDDNLQLTLYAIAYRKLFKKKEKCLHIDLLPRNSKSSFRSVETERTEEQLTQILELATKIQKIKELGIYIPQLQNCRACAYNKICKRK
ncbi:MAG: PD-(D/E)XK nuclease family protein [Candidatus Lokiarchaeota archaeon]|nr:PD-(D/E)XK nuclease family protein [Candidatus Lokiarchaeota archaeon]